MSETVYPLAQLVEDFDLYPRSQVSSTNVANIHAALDAGEVLPPPVIDRKSKRIVDGIHRCRAWRKHLGPDGIIDVDFRTFKSDIDMFRAAVELNVGHGLPLQEVEKRRITLRLQDMGASPDVIARTLHMPVDRITRLTLNTTTVVTEGGEITVEALKRPLFHFRGQEMTAQQAKAARSAPGTSYRLVVNQLRQAVRYRLIDPEDAKLAEDLRALATEITDYLRGGVADTG